MSVADGDTITVLTEQYQQVKVRLYGIDCPEKRQAFGNRARQLTNAQVYGRYVRVAVMDVDRYGRAVGVVAGAEGKLLNQALLEHGLAWLYPQYCRLPICGDWARIEAAARAQGVGLWSDKHAVPPWEYRRTRRVRGRR